MDLFQILADFLHLIAMGLLIKRIRTSRNSYGMRMSDKINNLTIARAVIQES